VIRPRRRVQYRSGKSDPIDAEAAARAVLAGTATGVPKCADGEVEMIRTLRTARRSAVKALNVGWLLEPSSHSARISFASASELKSSVSSTSSRRRALNDSIQGFCQGEPGSM
jgi:hypothetical protein